MDTQHQGLKSPFLNSLTTIYLFYCTKLLIIGTLYETMVFNVSNLTHFEIIFNRIINLYNLNHSYFFSINQDYENRI